MGSNSFLLDDDATNSTNNKTESEVCKDADSVHDVLFKLCIPLSVIVLFGLSFIIRRKNFCPGCCWGRPGFIQPLNFMDEIGRRWAYAACFVVVTYDIIVLFMGDSHLHLLPNKDEEWQRKFGWVSVFNMLLEAMCVCVVFYPLLACIDNRHSIAANIIGLIYLIPWIGVNTYFLVICAAYKRLTGAATHLITIPIYVALYVVGFSYILDLVLNCLRRRKIRGKANDEIKSASKNVATRGYKIGHHLEYVVNLLRKERSEQTEAAPKSAIKVKSAKLLKRAKYDKILGFCYSTRIVCSFTVSATFLIWIMIRAAVGCEFVIDGISVNCTEGDKILGTIHTFELSCEDVFKTRILLHVANVLAGLVITIFMFNTLITYKRRWHQLLRGDHSWHAHGPTITSPQNTLFKGLKFAGYQAAYVAWGWTVLMFTLSILFLFLTFALIMPLKDGVQNWLIKSISRFWPTLVVGIVIALAQKLICRFCFLQGKGTAMALENRRVYNAVSYYFLVLNVVIGFFSCLKRILIPLVLGVTFLSRLDRPIGMPGFERYDPGFESFVSMLLVDLYHNHPVVKTFVELMLQVREQREQQQQQEQQILLAGKGDEDSVQTAEKRRRSKMIRNRWLKALTLVNNPTLVLRILEQRLKNKRLKAEQSNQSPANAEDGSFAIQVQPLYDDSEATSSLQGLVR